MQTFKIPTDHSLRSTLPYGTAAFPFSYYVDDILRYENQRVDWHWHAEFEFSLVRSGTAVCQIGSEQIELASGGGLFINSGVIHSFTTAGQGVLLHIIFAPSFFAPETSALYERCIRPVLSSDRPYGVFPADDEAWREMRERIEEIYGAARTDSPVRELHIQRKTMALWETFFTNGAARLHAGASTGARLIQARLQLMMHYIHQNFSETVLLEDIAAAASISKSEALRCFHLGLDTTPVGYLNQYRLNQAKHLLQSTDSAVTSIAGQTGFETAGYFCSVFKKRYGCTPKAFRSAARAADRAAIAAAEGKTGR